MNDTTHVQSIQTFDPIPSLDIRVMSRDPIPYFDIRVISHVDIY